MPRRKDLSVYSQRDLDKIARSLNSSPRQTRGWMTPSQKFAKLRARPVETAADRVRFLTRGARGTRPIPGTSNGHAQR
jgi:hypothetical protein